MKLYKIISPMSDGDAVTLVVANSGFEAREQFKKEVICCGFMSWSDMEIESIEEVDMSYKRVLMTGRADSVDID